MLIPVAAVEPDDLVSIQVDDSFSIEFRADPNGPSFTRDGRRYLAAYATPNDLAAVFAPSGEVELIQRLDPPGTPGRESPKHPHGWAITRAGETVMHYFTGTKSLCGTVTGYAGLCYPSYRESFFHGALACCELCLEQLEQQGR